MIPEHRAAIMQAAVALAAAKHGNPTVVQVQFYYDLLVALVDPPEQPRPRADPSQYTASAVGR